MYKKGKQMKNNELIEYKEGFFSKIKNFFKNLFKNNKEVEIVQYEENIDNEIKTNDNFLNGIKVETNDINTLIEKKDFLKEIDGNIEMLNMLSIERLEKLKKYYDNVIEENTKKIENINFRCSLYPLDRITKWANDEYKRLKSKK